MAAFGITDWRKLGAVLREARLRQGLTQDGLAEQAGVSRAWLAKLEAGGHRRAEIEQVFKLLAALSLEMVVRDKQRSAGESGLIAALGRSDYVRRVERDLGRAQASQRAQLAVERRAAAADQAAARTAERAARAAETPAPAARPNESSP